MSKEKKRENPTAEEALAPQIATDIVDLSQGRIDVRRLSYLDPIDKIWMSHFLLIPEEEGGEYAREFVGNWLNLAMSEGGRRVTQMIQMVAGSKGAASGAEFVKRPGVLGRNISNRGWKRKAEEEGKVVVE